jgi:hypothetical protein
VITLTAKVFLITIFIFAIAIKRIFIIAFWTFYWYNFLHEDFILSGRYLFSCKNIVPQRIEVLNFHLSLQSVSCIREDIRNLLEKFDKELNEKLEDMHDIKSEMEISEPEPKERLTLFKKKKTMVGV